MTWVKQKIPKAEHFQQAAIHIYIDRLIFRLDC